MKTKHQAFTLIEILIVIVIFGILVTVLFRTFNTITELSLRSEFQKTVQSETLFVNQVFHSLADQYTIDFDTYESKDTSIDENGLTDTLHLIHADDVALATDDDNSNDIEIRRVIVQAQWCKPFNLEDISAELDTAWYNCQLTYQKSGEDKETPLTTHQIKLSHLKFQLMPYQSNIQTLQNTKKPEKVYQTLAYPWFVFYGRIYHRWYGRKQITNISQVLHRFFTLTDQAQL